jgi:hypothetical protein
MVGLSQYLRHPFNQHARHRKEQAKLQHAQRQEEMAEAALRADIPGADFERPVQDPRLYLHTHGHNVQGIQQNEGTTQMAHASDTHTGHSGNSDQLPIIQDRGTTWAKQTAQKTDEYWNSILVESSILIEETNLPKKRDTNAPAYPYWKSNSRAVTPDLVGGAPWSLTVEQRAELELLRERESCEAALEKSMGHKGKERVVKAEVLGQLDEPTAHGSPYAQSPQQNPFQQDLHVRMARTDFGDGGPSLSSLPLETTRDLARWSSCIQGPQELPSTAISRDFDPSVLLPTDQPVFIYRNTQGTHRLVLPREKNEDREESHGKESQPSSPSHQRLPSPRPLLHNTHQRDSQTRTTHASDLTTPLSSPTWNSTLNAILVNEHIDPKTVERVRRRASVSIRENGNGDESSISAIDVGLVPNFSYPSPAAEWNDRLSAERKFQDQDREFLENAYRPPSASTTSTVREWLKFLHETLDGKSEQKEGNTEVDRPLSDDNTNSWGEKNNRDQTPEEAKVQSSSHPGLRGGSDCSSSSSKTHYSDPTHIRPSGLATDADVEEYCLINPPSPTESLTTRLRTQEKTLATQAKLISTLHKKLDRVTKHMNYYTGTLIPELEERCDMQMTWIQGYLPGVSTVEQENKELWKTVDFSRKVLNLCWQRDAEVKRMVGEIRGRKAQRGCMQRLFGVWPKKEMRLKRTFSRKSSQSTKVSPKTQPTNPTPNPDSESRADSIRDTDVTHNQVENVLYNGIFSGVSSGAGPPPPPRSSRASSQQTSASNPPLRLERSRMSNLSLVFSSSKSDLEALARVTEQNLRVLGEDVEDWSRLQEACFEMKDARLERLEVVSVRDV